MLLSTLNSEISENDPRFEYIQIYSDYHKDAYGFRPRYNYSNYTLEQLVSDFERFGKVFDENQLEKEIAEKRAIESYEARILVTIELGAKDRKTALEWMCDADGVDVWDIGYYLWKQGIYDYNEYGAKLKDEIREIMIANLE